MGLSCFSSLSPFPADPIVVLYPISRGFFKLLQQVTMKLLSIVRRPLWGPRRRLCLEHDFVGVGTPTVVGWEAQTNFVL